MVASRSLVSATSRGSFKQLMTDSTLAAIDAAFSDEGFTAGIGHPFVPDTSERRARTEQYLRGINWSDPGQVHRAVVVFERLLVDVLPDSVYGPSRQWMAFTRAMERDGFEVSDDGHINRLSDPSWLDHHALVALRDPAAIEEQLNRIRLGLHDDPALAVGSAHDLIESTAKTVLAERGLTWGKQDLPGLVSMAQTALGLHPAAAGSGPDAAVGVRTALGGATAIARGVAELRNQYGTGHGSHQRSPLRARHARLAVHAAMTWCLLMLDTLHDPEAPWRTSDSDQAGAAGSSPAGP